MFRFQAYPHANLADAREFQEALQATDLSFKTLYTTPHRLIELLRVECFYLALDWIVGCANEISDDVWMTMILLLSLRDLSKDPRLKEC